MPVCGGIPAFRLAAGSPVHTGFEVATLDSGAFEDVESGLWVFALYTSCMPGFVIGMMFLSRKPGCSWRDVLL